MWKFFSHVFCVYIEVHVLWTCHCGKLGFGLQGQGDSLVVLPDNDHSACAGLWATGVPVIRTQLFLKNMFMYLNMCVCVHALSCFSCVRLFATVALQAPLSKGFSRQQYWSGLPWPLSGDLPDPGVKVASLMSPALADGFFTISATWETPSI